MTWKSLKERIEEEPDGKETTETGLKRSLADPRMFQHTTTGNIQYVDVVPDAHPDYPNWQRLLYELLPVEEEQQVVSIPSAATLKRRATKSTINVLLPMARWSQFLNGGQDRWRCGEPLSHFCKGAIQLGSIAAALRAADFPESTVTAWNDRSWFDDDNLAEIKDKDNNMWLSSPLYIVGSSYHGQAAHSEDGSYAVQAMHDRVSDILSAYEACEHSETHQLRIIIAGALFDTCPTLGGFWSKFYELIQNSKCAKSDRVRATFLAFRKEPVNSLNLSQTEASGLWYSEWALAELAEADIWSADNRLGLCNQVADTRTYEQPLDTQDGRKVSAAPLPISLLLSYSPIASLATQCRPKDWWEAVTRFATKPFLH